MFWAMSTGHVTSLVSFLVKSTEPVYLIASSPLLVFFSVALIADAVVVAQFALYRHRSEPELVVHDDKARAESGIELT